MSAWYIFSAMGFYPVNPVSGEYVVGSPFFEQISIDLTDPSSTTSAATKSNKLTITAIGARTKPYIKSLTIDGVSVDGPTIKHEQIAKGANVVFEMSDSIEAWGNDEDVLQAFGVDLERSARVRARKHTLRKSAEDDRSKTSAHDEL
ncbi:hypothetical protein CVT26_007977 [Gymnopilus dilepis]|uniref:Glycosyl hydrolase family 92 domain-containing protein n=1 Tax=Gymnopilus dilepis TaxID=231916 RepID=A0A409W0H3_9AGAR|nr:hypothetical protein CVT26_007977 [Gymnopilus dilepis]